MATMPKMATTMPNHTLLRQNFAFHHGAPEEWTVRTWSSAAPPRSSMISSYAGGASPGFGTGGCIASYMYIRIRIRIDLGAFHKIGKLVVIFGAFLFYFILLLVSFLMRRGGREQGLMIGMLRILLW
jgi:hypothetical protein